MYSLDLINYSLTYLHVMVLVIYIFVNLHFACPGSKSASKTNDVEGWHRRLNFRGRQHMCFYMLVQLLHEEAILITIQFRLISEKKLQKHQRKTYIHLQAKIFQLWQEYEDGHKSAQQLLNGCAKVYGPAV